MTTYDAQGRTVIPDAAWNCDIAVARAALACLNPQRAADFDQIRLVGRILHGVSPELFDDWREWASAHPGYTSERCSVVWASFTKCPATPVGPRILIKFVREDTGDPIFPRGVA